MGGRYLAIASSSGSLCPNTRPVGRVSMVPQMSGDDGGRRLQRAQQAGFIKRLRIAVL